jgi:hypothetical protein
MRVMMMIKADADPGATPSEELLAEMDRDNDELKKAGVLVDLAGLLPSAVGSRVRFSSGKRTVINGPFPDPKQVVAGYWILQVRSMDEARRRLQRPAPLLAALLPAPSAQLGAPDHG